MVRRFLLMTAMFIIANAHMKQHRLMRNRPILVTLSCPNGSGTTPSPSDGDSDFPKDLFSQEQRHNGAIVLHIICGLYCFIVIAFVCNDYFLPSVDCICQDLNLSKDVAGATFMAFATSAPELFVNVIGTFLTESDLGVGTVVGSAVFNTLGVAACGGLATAKAIRLHRWPLVRDCVIYMVVVAVLTGILWDERIEWYEALVLLILYVLYCVVLFGQKAIFSGARALAKKASAKKSVNISTDVEKNAYPSGSFKTKEEMTQKKNSTSKPPPINTISKSVDSSTKGDSDAPGGGDDEDDDMNDDGPRELWSFPRDQGPLMKTWWILSWPVAFFLHYSVPDCQRKRILYPITFLMCVVWIGIASYLVSWMMTVLGETFGISDSVMGLTLVAIGGSMPEASSSVINARRGVGSMTISNALGGNTLDILLSLGLPWFIKTQLPTSLNGGPVKIESSGLVYNNAAQLACVAALFVAAASNRFKMDRKLGGVCLVLYLLFIVFIVAVELNLFHFQSTPTASC